MAPITLDRGALRDRLLAIWPKSLYARLPDNGSSPELPRSDEYLRVRQSDIDEADDDFLDLEDVASTRWTRKRSLFMCGAIWLALFTIFLMLNLVLFAARCLWDQSSEYDNVESSANVDPIPCHSHNDYWRREPLFSALRAGCIGVEADVWLRGSELYVGHDIASLRANRTFSSLYIEPLVRLLEQRNTQLNSGNMSYHGVFDTDPGQTLVLLVDLKSDAEQTWPSVVKALRPLRDRGWLSYVNNSQVHYGPITVVGTGNTNFKMLVGNATYRDTFFDAPLDHLVGSGFDSTNSYYTSISFKHTIGFLKSGEFSEKQLFKLQGHIKEAHSRGLKVRYWALPAWPVHVRNHVWDVLVQEGVDILNVDDLRGVKREWIKRRHLLA